MNNVVIVNIEDKILVFYVKSLTFNLVLLHNSLGHTSDKAMKNLSSKSLLLHMQKNKFNCHEYCVFDK